MHLVCCHSYKSAKGRFAFHGQLCQEVFGAMCFVCCKTSKWKRVKPENLEIDTMAQIKGKTKYWLGFCPVGTRHVHEGKLTLCSKTCFSMGSKGFCGWYVQGQKIGPIQTHSLDEVLHLLLDYELSVVTVVFNCCI